MFAERILALPELSTVSATKEGVPSPRIPSHFSERSRDDFRYIKPALHVFHVRRRFPKCTATTIDHFGLLHNDLPICCRARPFRLRQPAATTKGSKKAAA
jgi:hypothetical protein